MFGLKAHGSSPLLPMTDEIQPAPLHFSACDAARERFVCFARHLRRNQGCEGEGGRGGGRCERGVEVEVVGVGVVGRVLAVAGWM